MAKAKAKHRDTLLYKGLPMKASTLLMKKKKDQGKRTLRSFSKSRAAVKLLQLDSKFNIVRCSSSVLCAAPKWTRVLGKLVRPHTWIIKALISRDGCQYFGKLPAIPRPDPKFDLILHDGKPVTRNNDMFFDAVKLVAKFLAPGGTFVTKVFGWSEDYRAVLYILKQLFEKIEVHKPDASRTSYLGFYCICLKYKAPADCLLEIDRRLDMNHLEDPASYAAEDFSFLQVCSAADFMRSCKPCIILRFVNAITFDDKASIAIANDTDTTQEVRKLCGDIGLLSKQNLECLLKWRDDVRSPWQECHEPEMFVSDGYNLLNPTTEEIYRSYFDFNLDQVKEDPLDRALKWINTSKIGDLKLKRKTEAGSSYWNLGKAEKTNRFEGTTCYGIIAGQCLVMAADGVTKNTEDSTVSRYNAIKHSCILDGRIIVTTAGCTCETSRVTHLANMYCSAPFDITVEYAARIVEDQANILLSCSAVGRKSNAYLVGGRNVGGQLRLFDVDTRDLGIYEAKQNIANSRCAIAHAIIGAGQHQLPLFLVANESRLDELTNIEDVSELEDQTRDFAGDVIADVIQNDEGAHTGGHITSVIIPEDLSRGVKFQKKEALNLTDPHTAYTDWIPFELC